MADYDRTHVDVTPLLSAHSYKAHQLPSGRTFARNREQHGARLSAGLAASFETADARRPLPGAYPSGVTPGRGAFVTVILDPASKEIDIEKPEKGIRQSAAGEDADKRTMVLHVSDQVARDYITERINRYRSGPLTPKDKPPLASEMQPIIGFAPTELMDLWREDPADLPSARGPVSWWGLWCWEDFVDDVTALARALKIQVAPEDRWSTFPDVRVVPVHATRDQMQDFLDFGQPGLAEIGFATDDPSILVDLSGREQDGLVEDLAARITWPGADVPVVCLLDTGVNRAHPLIEPALAPEDMHAVDEHWEVDDHYEGSGHGTPMAGLALHGDLTGQLADSSRPRLSHRLESVKFLSPVPRADDDPANYGAITKAAVALAELRQPDRKRAICSAATSPNRRGDRPSRWSAAIDEIASGVDAGEDEEPPRRLFIQSVGNIRRVDDWSAIDDPTRFPGEDPAQAWNALTVGGVTFKDAIKVRDRGAWSACASVGNVSPYSRTSSQWPDGTTPIKPEVVFEAGNRATNAAGDQVTDGMPSLSLISTGKGGAFDSLVPFHATSAATAQAARMSAQIMAKHPGYWPETVRALMVHSARWTEPMRAEVDAAGGKTSRSALRRKFGYGMPDLNRALASSSNDFALVAQASIQPFDRPGIGRRNPEQRVGAVTLCFGVQN